MVIVVRVVAYGPGLGPVTLDKLQKGSTLKNNRKFTLGMAVGVGVGMLLYRIFLG